MRARSIAQQNREMRARRISLAPNAGPGIRVWQCRTLGYIQDECKPRVACVNCGPDGLESELVAPPSQMWQGNALVAAATGSGAS
ncbi:hypothetical protein RR46_12802 [Papilio xuthus]|uniref:Uncharacterized protein n=1 Tax=Papilio xuthus TaxID=66420 RepID=A0A194PJZ1_PAPXU|nr:hypothetical protein RR46_12802 [Papilio xuthus]